jgi:hypothetical protein
VAHRPVEDVLDIDRARVRDRREVVADDAFLDDHREEADAHEPVAGTPEAAKSAAVTEEHAGEADERQGLEHDLCGHADRHVGGDDVSDVGRRVVDLDRDEDGAGDRGTEAGDRIETVGGGGAHVGLLCVGAGRVSGDERHAMSRCGDRTSQGDVIWGVDSAGCRSEQAEVRGSRYRRAAGLHVELLEDVLGVRAQRIHRDIEL